MRILNKLACSVALGLLFLAASVRAEDIPVNNLPDDIKDAIKNKWPKATATKAALDPLQHYEITLRFPDGTTVEVVFKANREKGEPLPAAAGGPKALPPEEKPKTPFVPPRPVDFVPEPALDPEDATPLVEVTPEMQKRIEDAIQKGILYLKDMQDEGGTFHLSKLDKNKAGSKRGSQRRIAYVAWPGLVLLECGVSRDDPAVKQAAAFVRDPQNWSGLYATYDLGAAILFLDRLRNPDDKKLIQTLALRLIAGQKANGGWTYHCAPQLDAAELAQLKEALDALTPSHGHLAAALQDKMNQLPTTNIAKPKPEKPSDRSGLLSQRPPSEIVPETILSMRPISPDSEKVMKDLPAKIKNLPVLTDPEKLKQEMKKGTPGDTDNSNTQFAMLALLAASNKQYEIPMDRTLALIVMRFTSSQNKDGSWSYTYKNGGYDRENDVFRNGRVDHLDAKDDWPYHEPMTGVGLLGLAIGHGLASDIWAQAASLRAKPEMKDKMDDKMVQAGFKMLSKHLEELVDKDGKLLKQNTHFTEGKLDKAHYAVMRNLYYLWTVERVGVLFQQKSVDGKDWYNMGARFLLASQQPDGYWNDGNYWGSREMTDTCFALLFLKRSNLAKELTRKLPSFQLGGDGK